MPPLPLASTQRSGSAAILVTPPGSRLLTATSPSRFTEVLDGLRARVSREGMQAFVATLEIPEAAKAELLQLTPWGYIGKAAELAKRI